MYVYLHQAEDNHFVSLYNYNFSILIFSGYLNPEYRQKKIMAENDFSPRSKHFLTQQAKKQKTKKMKILSEFNTCRVIKIDYYNLF